MAKKLKSVFPDVDACETIMEIRFLHATIATTIYGSPKYWALMQKWQQLCLGEALFLANDNSRSNGHQWRKLYESCPSGTAVEKIAVAGLARVSLGSRDFKAYRSRVIREARQAIATLGLERLFAW